jgi:hypothetical protein
MDQDTVNYVVIRRVFTGNIAKQLSAPAVPHLNAYTIDVPNPYHLRIGDLSRSEGNALRNRRHRDFSK